MAITFDNVHAPSPGAPASALVGQTVRRRFNNEKTAFTLSDFVWETDPCDNWHSNCHVINFALTPRPQPAWVSFGGIERHSMGPVMFVPQGIDLSSGISRGRQRSLTGLLSSETIERILGRRPHWKHDDLVSAVNLRNPAIEQVLLRIARELERPGFASALLLESLGDALAVELIRVFRLEQAPKAICTGGLAPWRMRRIRDRIEADAPAPDLTELSEICGISIRHLTRAFKAETGQTLAGYVQHAVMERARVMLTQSDQPIADIAKQLGFAGSASFCYAYRRYSGQRPSDLRKVPMARH